MTDKRITELTALAFADLAATDELVVVDVSDTTMGASGTTKRIVPTLPGGLSRLFATNPGAAGTASGATVHPELTANSLVGTDIAIDAGDTSYINILVDGVYAITIATSFTTGGTQDFTETSLQLLGLTLVPACYDDIPSGGSYASRTVSAIQFISAGATLRGEVYASRGAAGTWDIVNYSINVQRVV